jgi:Seadornavirus VP7.
MHSAKSLYETHWLYRRESRGGKSGHADKKAKNLSLKDSLKIEQTVESFVRRLHRKGLSHGDLNPGNLIVDRGTALKIIDPLELMPKKKAMKDDFAWVSYLKKELKNYRNRLSAGKG